MDMKVSSTIAYERAHNALLAETDEARFVARTTGALPPQPPNFKAIVEANRGAEVAEPCDVTPLTPRQVEVKRNAGALVVDVRTDLQFDDGHIPGAVCNPAIRAGFGTKLAWIAGRDQEIVLVGRDDDDARRAARLADAVGITRLGGLLSGGMTSWREERRPVASIERIDPAELHERLEREPGLQVLDVRETAEFEERHIPGSVHVPYHDLRELPGELDAGRPVAVICSSGQRSAVAASLLARQGAQNVLHVADGGVGTWADRGWPVQ